MISVYLICQAIGGIASRLRIFSGSKRAVMLGSFITITAYSVIMISNNLQIRVFAFGLMGLGMVIKNAFSYEWLVACVGPADSCV